MSLGECIQNQLLFELARSEFIESSRKQKARGYFPFFVLNTIFYILILIVSC
jgi:hypothetical protein